MQSRPDTGLLTQSLPHRFENPTLFSNTISWRLLEAPLEYGVTWISCRFYDVRVIIPSHNDHA